MREAYFKRKVEELASYGYDFRVTDYIKQGFDIFGKYPGGLIIFSFLFLLFSFLIGLVPGLSLITAFTISPALTAGAYIVAQKVDKNKDYSFNNFFDGFKHFVPLMLASLVMLLIVFIITLIFLLPGLYVYFSSGGIATPTVLLLCLLGLIPLIYLSLCYTFTGFHIVFNGFQFWDALESSRKVISKRWGSMFLFSLLLTLMNILGLICLVIGLLVTVPVSYGALYAAFDDIVGSEVEELSEFDQLSLDVDNT